MRKRQMEKDLCREFFDYDDVLGVLRYKISKPKIKVGDIAGTSSPDAKGYYAIKFDYIKYKRHNLIWNWHYGTIPDDLVVDHIDNVIPDIGANDKIENLQLLTYSQNTIKRKMSTLNTSGYFGVHWNARDERWVSRISVGGKRIILGNFHTAEEAALAYDEGARIYHGQVAKQNFKGVGG